MNFNDLEESLKSYEGFCKPNETVLLKAKKIFDLLNSKSFIDVDVFPINSGGLCFTLVSKKYIVELYIHNSLPEHANYFKEMVEDFSSENGNIYLEDLSTIL